MFTLCRVGMPPVQSADSRWIRWARSSSAGSDVRSYSQKSTSSVSPQRVWPQPSRNTSSGWPATKVKNRVRTLSILVSSWNSAHDRSACSIGMCGHRSAWPRSLEVRRRVGPKNPSGATVASTASTQRSVSASTRASPVT
jgi:hypothetical protein